MMRFLFKVPRHKRFEFKPRYYDADREALQMRIRAYQSERGELEGHDPDVLRGRLSHAWRTNSNRSATKRSNKNVMIIAVLLGLIAYFLFYT